MFCDANSMFWDALLRFKRDPGLNPACGKKFFCLNIKKFWYTCEKDKFNDVNKHLFDKMYWQKKNSNFY